MLIGDDRRSAPGHAALDDRVEDAVELSGHGLDLGVPIGREDLARRTVGYAGNAVVVFVDVNTDRGLEAGGGVGGEQPDGEVVPEDHQDLVALDRHASTGGGPL